MEEENELGKLDEIDNITKRSNQRRKAMEREDRVVGEVLEKEKKKKEQEKEKKMVSQITLIYIKIF